MDQHGLGVGLGMDLGIVGEPWDPYIRQLDLALLTGEQLEVLDTREQTIGSHEVVYVFA